MESVVGNLLDKYKKELSVFDENDWNHFHDVIIDVTWDDEKLNLSKDECIKMFLMLPQHLKDEANLFGMNDTVWRGKLSKWYSENKDNVVL